MRKPAKKPASKRNAKGQFKEGESYPAGPGRGHKKPKEAAGEILLRDLHKAYEQDEQPSDSAVVKSMRKMAHEDLPKFLSIWAKAKGDAGEGFQIGQTEVATVATVTAKEEKVESLIVKLLAEWEVEDALGGTAPVAVPGGGDGRNEAGGEGEGRRGEQSGIRRSGVEVAGAGGSVERVNKALSLPGGGGSNK